MGPWGGRGGARCHGSPAPPGINLEAGNGSGSEAALAGPPRWLFGRASMEKQSEDPAAAEPASSGEEGGEGGPPQVAGAQAARPEDRVSLLLRLLPLAARPEPSGRRGKSSALCGECPGFKFSVSRLVAV